MTPPLRFGLVGCGRIGVSADDRAKDWPAAVRAHWLPYSHASAIAATAGARLVATCDLDLASAERARERFGADAAYSDHRAMIDRERLDAIAVATRTGERPQIVADAIRHGVRAVYCEKPLATTLEEADALAASIRERRIAFAYGTRRRAMKGYRHAYAAVRAGAIGDLTAIVVRFGRGGLLWNHPHAIDIACLFAGDQDVAWVQADLELDDQLVRGDVVDCDPIVRMGHVCFANGVRASIIAGDGQDVELLGTKGNLVVRADGAHLTWLKHAREGIDYGWLLDERTEPVELGDSGAASSIAHLVRALRGDEPPVDPRPAFLGHEVLFGWVESHLAGGRRQSLPLTRRRLCITGRTGDKLA